VIWKACDGQNHIKPISGTLHRLVESQEQVATMGYVDDMHEQSLLETMLDEVKPPYPENPNGYHYLLTTPFRYPPLNHGSRFGRTNEPSLFYGGCSPDTTLAEAAYYRFVFISTIADVTALDRISTEHTMFSVDYYSNNGIQLHAPPFSQFDAELKHTENYAHAQDVGSAMRASGVDAFEYCSARDTSSGFCVALFNKSPFQSLEPKSKAAWLCITTLNQVSFKRVDSSATFHYPVIDFQVDGRLPLPA